MRIEITITNGTPRLRGSSLSRYIWESVMRLIPEHADETPEATVTVNIVEDADLNTSDGPPTLPSHVNQRSAVGMD